MCVYRGEKGRRGQAAKDGKLQGGVVCEHASQTGSYCCQTPRAPAQVVLLPLQADAHAPAALVLVPSEAFEARRRGWALALQGLGHCCGSGWGRGSSTLAGLSGQLSRGGSGRRRRSLQGASKMRSVAYLWSGHWEGAVMRDHRCQHGTASWKTALQPSPTTSWSQSLEVHIKSALLPTRSSCVTAASSAPTLLPAVSWNAL